MTHEELMTKLDSAIDFQDSWVLYNALRAVVELHKPIGSCCSHFILDEDYETTQYFYSCPTIRAIEKELK